MRLNNVMEDNEGNWGRVGKMRARIGAIILYWLLSFNANGLEYNEFVPDPHTLFLAHYNTGTTADVSSGTPAPIQATVSLTTKEGGYIGEGINFATSSVVLQYAGNDGNISSNRGAVEFWFKPAWSSTSVSPKDRANATDGKRYHALFSYGRFFNGENNSLCLYTDDYWNIFCVAWIDNDGKQGNIASDLGFKEGEWYHIAIEYDNFNSGTSNASIRFYENGTAVEETTKQTISFGSPRAMFIGNITTDRPANGIIDELRISDVVRYGKDFTPPPRHKYPAGAPILNPKGKVIAEARTTFVKSAGKVRRLNNLAIELLNLKGKVSAEYKEYNFENPREGWIFVSTTADIKDKGRVSVSIDAAPEEESIIIHDKAGVETLEAMRFLSGGEHKLNVWSEGKASYGAIVRAIPELMFNSVGGWPPMKGYVPEDYWQFLQKYVARNVNCMVSGSSNFTNDPNYMLNVEGWKKQGKKWIYECGVPGASNVPNPNEPVTADGAYEYWSKQPGFQHPLLDGVFANEFLGRFPRQKYNVWTKAIKMLPDSMPFAGRTFSAYFGGSAYREGLKVTRLIDGLMQGNHRVGWEIYLPEKPTEQEAKESLQKKLGEEILNWEKELPGVTEHMIVVLAYLSFITRETVDNDPSVDFKVFMDMQLNHIANEPAFSKVYGLMWYNSGYASEETVRWASRLFRHYAIEGKTGMLSEEHGFKYALNHILNPDFGGGTDGWEIGPAKSGSMETRSREGFGALESRFHRATGQGDTFLWMKRNEKCPNIVWQEIKHLRPGKLYSLKMVTADYKDLVDGKSEKKEHGISIEINNVELVSDKCFREVRGSMVTQGTFSEGNAFWFNLHWKVFRAKSTSAALRISDWKSDKEPGAPIGQELAVNFVEVQPYFEE